MYLPDGELSKRLTEFAIEAEADVDPFDPDVQVGPASVDMRLSSTYWEPQPGLRLRRGRTIDLTQTATRDINPTRGWRQVKLRAGSKLVLKPGQIVLGRTSERFAVPRDCAAAIEGRSSYARMGLSVHASGGFINPGWSGRMPLTLHNEGPFAIKIPAGAPICQVMFIKLTGPAEDSYADRADRKYENDYGGPSYWWRDKIIRRILSDPNRQSLSDQVLGELEVFLDADQVSDDALERLEEHVDNLRIRQVSNTVDLLDAFARAEDRRILLDRFSRWALPLFAGAFGLAAIRGLAGGISKIDAALIVAAVVSVSAAGFVTLRARLAYLTTDKLREIRSS